MPKVKQIPKADISGTIGHIPYNLDDFPNFHKSGSIRGMKKLYYGKDALLVRCGSYIYNVTRQPDIYNIVAQ